MRSLIEFHTKLEVISLSSQPMDVTLRHTTRHRPLWGAIWAWGSCWHRSLTYGLSSWGSWVQTPAHTLLQFFSKSHAKFDLKSAQIEKTNAKSFWIKSEMLFGVRECPLESVIQCYVPNNYTTLYIWKNIWRTNWISTVSNLCRLNNWISIVMTAYIWPIARNPLWMRELGL